MNIPTETIVKNKLALAQDHINKNQLNNAENILNDLLQEDPVSIESLIWLALIKKKFYLSDKDTTQNVFFFKTFFFKKRCFWYQKGIKK